MVKRVLIVLGILAAAGAGAYFYYRKQLEELENFTYNVIGINIGDYSVDHASLFLKIRITSNSTIDATIKDLSIDVFMDGQKVGNIEDTRPFIIPAKGYSDVDLTVALSPKLVLASAGKVLTSLIGQKDFAINLRGFIRIRSAFLQVSVPFSYDSSLKQLLSKS